jgi:protease I
MKNITLQTLTLSLTLLGAPALRAATVISPAAPSDVPAGMSYDVKPDPVRNPQELRGKRIAVLASHGVQDIELSFPVNDLQARGATVDIFTPSWISGRVLLVDFVKPTSWASVKGSLESFNAQDYDMLFIPGGAWTAKVLRTDTKALEILQDFYLSGKPVAVICAGSEVLINAGLVKGQRVTGTPSIREDLENAGGTYVDEPVVLTENLIMSRSPGDLVEFTRAMRAALR